MAKKAQVENFDYGTSGKPLKDYDPSRKGPIRNRSCTDIICCLIFFIFVLGLLAVGLYAYVWGDPKTLLYPMDSDGNLCGYGNLKGKDKLFFFDLVQCGRMGPGIFVNGCPTPQVCVSECPSTNWVFAEDMVTGKRDNLICQAHVDKATTPKSVYQLVKDKDCAAYYLDSKPILNRCVPLGIFEKLADELQINNLTAKDSANRTISKHDVGVAQELFNAFLKAKEYAEKIINDIITTWYLILGALVIAMVVSLVWIFLLRWVAGFMVWLAVLLFVSIFAALTGVCFWMYWDSKDSGETYTIHMGFEMTFSKEKFFLLSGIIVGIIFLIVFLILLFLCQRIRIAIQLIKEGSKAIGNMMFTLLWPIFPFLFQLLVVAVWISIAMYLASIDRNQKLVDTNVTLDNDTETKIKQEVKHLFEEIPCDTNQTGTLGQLCGVIRFGKGDFTIYLQIFNLFMGFWLMNFVIGLGQMTLAGAFASYFWAFDKSKDIPTFPLLAAFWRCFRYHLGTIAFGSLLIAIVQLIRILLEYLDAKLKGSENPAAKFFLKCLKCCFWCLEKFIKFITKNAYIMVAIYGKNFCVSAKDAFCLILRNVVRVAVVDKVTDFVLFMSRLVIIGAVGTGTYFFFDGRIPYLNRYTPSLNFYVVPIVIVIVGCYLITSVFFSVYSMAVDTLFLCFLEDLERNDGSPEKPYFMSKGLKQILGKKNKAPPAATETQQ